MSNCVTIWFCYTVYWIFKTLLANGNSRVKPETLTGKAPTLPVLSKQIEIATQSLLHLKHDFPEVLLTFLKNKPYVHLSDISKGNEFLRCLTQKQEGPLAQVHFIQLIMATTTLNSPSRYVFEEKDWFVSRCTVSGCAVLTQQMTPQRFGKQLFATTTFCTWLEACDMLGTGELHQSLPSLTGKKKQHLEPFPYLKTEQFSDKENEVYI